MTQKYTQGANQRLPRCSASAGTSTLHQSRRRHQGRIISTCPEGESKLCALGRQSNTSFSAEWTTGSDVRVGSEVFRRTGVRIRSSLAYGERENGDDRSNSRRIGRGPFLS